VLSIRGPVRARATMPGCASAGVALYRLSMRAFMKQARQSADLVVESSVTEALGARSSFALYAQHKPKLAWSHRHYIPWQSVVPANGRQQGERQRVA
jgi:hypothetical protein